MPVASSRWAARGCRCTAPVCLAVVLSLAGCATEADPVGTTDTSDPAAESPDPGGQGGNPAEPGAGGGGGAGGAGDTPGGVGTGGAALPETDDPGTGPFEPVPAQEVEGECGLDPALLAQIDQRLNLRWGIVRYGKLCHEFYPGQDSPDSVDHVFSATKTFAAMVFGRLVYETRDLEVKGPRTGPIDPFQRVDQWIDLSGSRYDIHRDATIAHVLAMVAYSDDLSFGQKAHSYDTDGTREINALSDILNAAIRQDPERLGSDLEEFTQRYVYAPLGMTHSTWNDGAPDKIFAYSWNANIRDMLRVGLLINNGGVWNDERLVSARYLYDMIHPAFEDGNTGYGYLTWLNGKNHRPPLVGQLIKSPTPTDGCAPLAIHKTYPHGISESPDCGYDGAPQSCAQEHDVGAWSAQGLNGNYIYGHRGLDLVIAIQNYGTLNGVDALWNAVRPALVAVDPTYEGDDAAFCADYGRNAYAPDLALWEGGL